MTPAQPAVIINRRSPAGLADLRMQSASACVVTAEWRNVTAWRAIPYSRLSEGPRPFVYYPLLQTYAPSLTIHARAIGDLAGAIRRVRTHVQAVDPTIPITRSTTLAEQTKVALSVYELAAGALTMFGLMTIVLAASGIYGLVAYTVQQSTQEIGIRMAIGASRANVAWSFLGRGAMLAGIGAVIGLVLAAAASGAIRSLLYGVGARDIVSFGGGTLVVMAIALTASLLPAWRASKTDPLTALRRQ